MNNTVDAFATLAATEAFSAPVESLTLDQQVEAYAAAMYVEEAAKARRDALRESLMQAAQDGGKCNEKGGYRLTVGPHVVLRERRVSSTPDEKKLLSLIEAKKLIVEAAFDKVTVLQPNPSKVTALVDSGHLEADEASALYKQTYALVVRASAELESLYESVTPPTMISQKKSR